MRQTIYILISLCIAGAFLSGCEDAMEPEPYGVPHVEKYGIYALDLATEDVELIYSSAKAISFLHLNNAGDKFIFSQQIDGDGEIFEEICTVDMDGENFVRITDNAFWDLYPVWSPNDEKIAFLSERTDSGLDIYVMNADGSDQHLLYDSGDHDADIDWRGSYITYTQDSQIWIINDDGTEPTQVTDPPNAGQWGNANLPFGDYDPRINPQETKIVFERLEDDQSIHGNYNIYVIDINGSNEIPLTDTGYSQGIANWSHSGYELVYIVAAIEDEGKYDIWMMNSDGEYNRNITPDYFPDTFLCHNAMFSLDDNRVYFTGEWWGD
jgi:TolB protein